VTKISLFIFTLILSFQALASSSKGQYIQPSNLSPKVRIETSMGNVIIQLDRYRAKITVNNFLGYVSRGQYDKTLIHRVEEGYLIQGGGFMTNYSEVEPDDPIFNESGNGLKNKEGTIAMAKQLTDAHSATNQFFINLNDNDNLNPGSSWGYAVFGEVIEDGMTAIDAIAAIPRCNFGGAFTEIPMPNYVCTDSGAGAENFVTIVSVTVTDSTENSAASLSPVMNTSLDQQPPPIPTIDNDTGSGGGSTSWLILSLLGILSLFRNTLKS